MKNNPISLFCVLSVTCMFLACKKEYTCTCEGSTTIIGTDYNEKGERAPYSSYIEMPIRYKTSTDKVSKRNSLTGCVDKSLFTTDSTSTVRTTDGKQITHVAVTKQEVMCWLE